MTDPLAPLLELADIGSAFADARAAVDRAMRHRALRRSGGPVAAEVGLRAAVASAALEGHHHDREGVRNGLVTDPVLQGALRVSRALDGLTGQWTRAPRQVLARLHMLAGRDVVPDDQLGRPIADPDVSARLDALAAVIVGAAARGSIAAGAAVRGSVASGAAAGAAVRGSVASGAAAGARAPAMLLAAVVHGELLALAPFAGPSGVVARGAARISLMASGFDPRGLLAVDIGHLERQPEYQGSAGAFATGTPDGLRSWLKHYAGAVVRAADEVKAIGDEIADP